MTWLPQFCLGLTALATLASCTASRTDHKNKVVVKVNESTLSAAEFAELLASRLKVFNVLSSKDTAVVTQAKSAIVQDFIVRVVTEEWAQAQQIFVRKEQLESEVLKIRNNYPDDIAFRKSLADEGLAFPIWEARLKHTLLERLVVEWLRAKIPPPSAEEIKSYYTANKSQFQVPAAVRLRQIVLDTEESATRIKKELASGKSMASLAKKFSVSAEAQNGGDVGWIEKGTFEIFDAAFRMNIGQRSQVVKSPFGFHIFEVTAKRPVKNQTIDEAKNKITARLMQQKEQDVYATWLEEQVLKARVFKDDEFLKQIQVQTGGRR